MARKKYDITVKVGEFKTREGETKAEWRRVGVVMENDDGSEYIILERTFNPAGVPNPENRATVILSLFQPRDDNQQGQARQQPQARAQPQRQAPPPVTNGGGYAPQTAGKDDDIPF